ncbi:hypothetical protein [Hymenobacter sp. APR13]|jgi:hypothetical protein|uniref:hypothetical protein n=1 Tax=Hymenobacter sp. APR13 TaxID=1356852 RepID=UPI0004E04C03|nr:hypothetical protein [Hymenobacter sp. APR13]AII52949.1 hypothetical protein N008_13310 [Hymenobacter sp. APR13]
MPAFEDLLHEAFRRVPNPAPFLAPTTLAAYSELQQAPARDLSFRFERVRLATAMSILQLLSDLGDNDDSRKVVEALNRALQARSIAEIDNVMHKEAKAFERLYTNLYVNDEGELLLNLFERTLDADSQALMDDVIREATALAATLDFERDEDDYE